MRLPEVDWVAVYPLLVALDAGDDLMASVADLPVQKKFPRDLAGPHAKALVRLGALEETPSGNRLKHTPASRALRVVLRAAAACRIFDEEDGRAALKEYLARNFTGAQRAAALGQGEYGDRRSRAALLAHVTSARWARQFLELTDPIGFDREHAGSVYPRAMDAEVHDAACELVRAAAVAPLMIPDDVPEGAPFVRAIEVCVRYLLLFPVFTDGGLELALYPDVAPAIHDDTGPPEVVRREMPPPHPFLLHDAETILVHAWSEPIRVKAAGNALYQRDEARLAGLLGVAPTLDTPEERVTAAVNALLSTGGLEFSRSATSKRCLVPTDAGQRWLGLDPIEKLDGFIAFLRTGQLRKRLEAFLPEFHFLAADEAKTTWNQLIDLYRGLPRDGGVVFDAYLRDQVLNHTPFSDEDPFDQHWYVERWAAVVHRFLDWLMSVGGLVLARAGSDVLVGACDMGDYILGLREKPPQLPTSDARVVVQPNFDIVCLSPSPPAVAALARFCQREDKGQVGTLFRLTPASIARAGAAGLTLADLEAALVAHTEGGPANVMQDVSTWFQRVRRVPATSGIVLECPDEATADRLEGEARGSFRRVAPTVLVATDRGAFDRIASKLRSAGIVFDLDLSADPKPRKRATRRRRRRW